MKLSAFIALLWSVNVQSSKTAGRNDIIPSDYDDITDAETVRVLAYSGSRSSPFVSRGKAFLDRFQKLLTNTDITKISEEKLLKSDAWNKMSSMAKLRRLHIIRQNAKNRYLRFGKSFCLHVKKLAPVLMARMANMTEDERAKMTSKVFKFFESRQMNSKSSDRKSSVRSSITKAVNSTPKVREAKPKVSEDEGKMMPTLTFISATRKLESLRSSLHDFIVFKCAIEKDIMSVIEEFLKTIYFGDYRRLFADVERILLR